MSNNLIYAICFFVAAAVIFAIALVAHSLHLQFFTRRFFVKRAAKKLEIQEEEVERRFRFFALNDAKNLCAKHKVNAKLTSNYARSKRWALGASTDKAKRIVYSPVWIYLVVTKPCTWQKAFLLSIAHEIAHWSEPKLKWSDVCKGFAALRFRLWVSEVRCDILAMHMVEEYLCPQEVSRKSLVNAMQHKAEYYDKMKKHPGRASFTHPTWKLRVALLKANDVLTYEVVTAVASMAGCRDKQYIEHIAKQMQATN